MLKDPTNLPQTGHDNHQIWQNATNQPTNQSQSTATQTNPRQSPAPPQPNTTNQPNQAPNEQAVTPTISEQQVFAENAASCAFTKRAT